jgi:hypothetical protein
VSDDRLTVPVSFAGAGHSSTAGGARLLVATDGERAPVALTAGLARPAVARDALFTLGDVLVSDLRRRATDRADYLAYLVSRGKGVSKKVWEAQKEYLALQYSAAAREDEPLDPVLTVGDDAVRLEVLSRDESAYAQLTLPRPLALADDPASGGQPARPGTTFVDLAATIGPLGRVRAFRPTTLEVGAGAGERVAHTRTVPLRWLRAFGQMQAATLLATDRFEVRPIDLYNVLLRLRLKKARTAPRGLRYELVPGERPRLVLEPWDFVVHATGEPYRGSQPRVVRTWGRHRLAALGRILPHARAVTVAVAGPGLPATYTVDLGDATLSLALSGWVDAGWAGVSTFDLLAADQDAGAVEALVAALRTPMSPARLAETLGFTPAQVRRTALAALAQLRVARDLATGELYARPLLSTPVSPAALRFRDAREAAAHRLLEQPGAVVLTKVHDRGAEGRGIEGQVVDAAAHRTYHPAFTIDREGRTAQATCTCPAFRRAGTKEGPCEHMIALRVQLAREQARLEAARQTEEGRALVTAETRVLTRRTARGAETFRLSLDGRQVTARYGLTEPLRMLSLRFDTADEARAAYFTRLADLGAKGYLDATGE